MSSIPTELAPEARDLLLAFCEWCSAPKQQSLIDDDEWTMEQMVDLFIMEASV